MEDVSNNLPDILARLNQEQKDKLAQFKDLSGLEELKCFQILRANDWNLEVALDLALEGAYNDDQTLENFNGNNEHNYPSMQENAGLRRRNLSSAGTQSSVNDFSQSESTGEENEERAINRDNQDSLYVVLWKTTTWILKLPFMIVMNTLNAFYDFFVSMIHPSLHYDPNGTVERFITEYEEKYGQQHPTFFRGTYFRAVEQGKRDIRFVLIYLHSSSYRDTDRFCTTVLASPRFIDLINSQNLLFWGCSVDYPDGYKAFQSLKASTYPFLGLVGLRNHKMIVMKKIEGIHDLDSVIMQLESAVNSNEHFLMAARMDREERDMASQIRAQQDLAFEESLKADREKERKKREERERKEREERLAKQKKQEEEERRDKILRLKKTLLDRIPREPEPKDNSLRIVFKFPDGKRIERKFFSDDPVKSLYYFVFCNEENLFNFKLRTNFPARDLPGHSPSPGNDGLNEQEMNIPLDRCGLSSNIVLFVHDLDS